MSNGPDYPQHNPDYEAGFQIGGSWAHGSAEIEQLEDLVASGSRVEACQGSGWIWSLQLIQVVIGAIHPERSGLLDSAQECWREIVGDAPGHETVQFIYGFLEAAFPVAFDSVDNAAREFGEAWVQDRASDSERHRLRTFGELFSASWDIWLSGDHVRNIVIVLSEHNGMIDDTLWRYWRELVGERRSARCESSEAYEQTFVLGFAAGALRALGISLNDVQADERDASHEQTAVSRYRRPFRALHLRHRPPEDSVDSPADES